MSKRMKVVINNIASLNVDAVVNAANMFLVRGGGVDNAIHVGAGPELQPALMQYPDLQEEVRCRIGEVRVTPGFNLPAKFIIHTVGPVYVDGRHGENIKLSKCYRNALDAAKAYGCKSIAFPCISTGVFKYPVGEAASIAVTESWMWNHCQEEGIDVTFCCFTPEDAEWYTKLIGDPMLSGYDNQNQEPAPDSSIESDLILFESTKPMPPCPICGKQPKVVYRHFGGDGIEAVIRCKPWYRRRPHLAIKSCAASQWWAYVKAKKDWATAVKVCSK